MKTRTTLTIVGLFAALTGCANQESPSLVVLPEGYQVVAEGVPPIGFFMASAGQVIVTDTSANNTVYSMDSTRSAGSILKVEEDKLVVMAPNANGTPTVSTTLLTGLDAEHSYRIVFRPASAATMPAATLPTTARSR